VSLQQLKTLAEKLITIHGQHAHHQLLKTDTQRQLLDNFAEHNDLLEATAASFQHWQQLKRTLAELQAKQQQRQDKKQLLSYQVKELDDFALVENEFAQLEQEFKRLSHSQMLLEQSQQSFYQLYESEQGSALSAIQQNLDKLEALLEQDAKLSPIVECLKEATINVEEAGKGLRHYVEHVEVDPQRVQHIEKRYNQALELARKHQVQPENLYTHHQNLTNQLKQLSGDETRTEELTEAVEQVHQQYHQQASALSHSRQQAALTLGKELKSHIHQMNMPHARITIQVNFDLKANANKLGADEVVFTVSTNPGQPADSLDKVLSGGELSRFGLAMQVICAKQDQVPSLIFDEVDTGISGATAAVVGQLLRRLGEKTQVICVTHLPQVAATAHHQMLVSKISDTQSTETQIHLLDENQRVTELAKLLTGDTLTDSAMANAKSLLVEQNNS
jgi:DNA repair protein RecN (Recombination protein N)